MFVSPLSESCENRFRYDRHGEVNSARSDDVAAATTISKLNLDERPERDREEPRSLISWRRDAISGVLSRFQELPLKEARQRLTVMQERERELREGADVTLAPFCFAIRQALVRHIWKVEAIRAQLA